MTRARPIYSIEVFAPRTAAGVSRLQALCAILGPLAPAYVSVTCTTDEGGPERTYRTVGDLRARLGAGADITPHLTCVRATRDGVRDLLGAYRNLGVHHLVVVRGDLPAGMREWTGDFPHAGDLVGFVRAETGDSFDIEVAAHPEFHPEAPGADADLDHFRRKTDAGATSALTQYFYNADAYERFVESCTRLGVTCPIVPGIMPITDLERLYRFSDGAGVEIPRWLRKRLDGLAHDPGSVRAYGLDVVMRLCARLLEDGAPGLHFYTLNQAEPLRTLWGQLGLPCTAAAAGPAGANG